MDSLTSFKELAICRICFELFNEDSKCPRLLPCGHTFCHSCLEKILLQSPSCPTCKAEIQSLTADIIPVNYVAKSLICLVSQDNNPSEIQNKKYIIKKPADSGTMKLESEGFCTDHSNDKQLRCMDCESWICGTCCALKHKQCRTLLVKDAYMELKRQISDNVEEELESRKGIIDKIKLPLKYLEEQRKKLIEEIRKYDIILKECNMKIININSLKLESSEFSEYLRQVQTDVKTSKNDTEISKVLNKFYDLLVQGKNWLTQLENLKLYPIYPATLEDLRKLSQETRKVYVVDNENEPLYGKVTLMGEQIRISSFSPFKSEGLLFPFTEFLQNFGGSSDLPNMVYMKVKSVKGQMTKEVYVVIKMNETSPHTKNFVLLCSGLKRHTYKGMKLNCISIKYTLTSDLPPVVEGINFANNSGWIFNQEGTVYVNNGMKSGFSIALSSQSFSLFSHRNCGLPIGDVISGLKEMQELYDFNKSGIIVDCGLVIQMNHKPGGGTYKHLKIKCFCSFLVILYIWIKYLS